MAVSKKPAADHDTQIAEFAKEIIEILTSGALDGHLSEIDGALAGRVKVSNDKQVASATRKTTPAPTPVLTNKMGAAKPASSKPKVGGTYTIANSKREELKGAKVTLKAVVDGEGPLKVSVVMVTDRPGWPTGKQFRLPFAALKEVVARTPVKTPAKKVAAKPAAAPVKSAAPTTRSRTAKNAVTPATKRAATKKK